MERSSCTTINNNNGEKNEKNRSRREVTPEARATAKRFVEMASLYGVKVRLNYTDWSSSVRRHKGGGFTLTISMEEWLYSPGRAMVLFWEHLIGGDGSYEICPFWVILPAVDATAQYVSEAILNSTIRNSPTICDGWLEDWSTIFYDISPRVKFASDDESYHIEDYKQTKRWSRSVQRAKKYGLLTASGKLRFRPVPQKTKDRMLTAWRKAFSQAA